MWTTRLKQFLYPLYIYPRISAAKKKLVKRLFENYKAEALSLNITDSAPKALKVFSNLEEDGIILWLIATLNIAKGTFVDIGSNDCINSNCANLVFNLDWQGVFIDGNKKLLSIGKRNYALFGKLRNNSLKFVHSFLTPENINDVVQKNISTPDIDFVSIDIDGNDYAIWDALYCIKPKLVVVENKVEYGMNDIIVPANDFFSAEEWGASPLSITKLAEKKDYSLVALNIKGFNAFYIRNDLIIPSVHTIVDLQSALNMPLIKGDLYDNDKMKSLFKKLEDYHNSINE